MSEQRHAQRQARTAAIIVKRGEGSKITLLCPMLCGMRGVFRGYKFDFVRSESRQINGLCD